MITQVDVSEPQIVVGTVVCGCDAKLRLVGTHGRFDVVLIVKGVAEIVIGIRMVGVQLNALLEGENCPRCITRCPRNVAQLQESVGVVRKLPFVCLCGLCVVCVWFVCGLCVVCVWFVFVCGVVWRR